MHLEYTPEEVRALVADGGVLTYEAATTADIAEATDVLEGVEELIAKLDPAVRRETLAGVALETGAGSPGELWVPVANNCRRSAGVSVSPEGLLSFAVRGEGKDLVTYIAARQAAAHALSGRAVVTSAAEGELPDPEENCLVSTGSFAGAFIDVGDDPEGVSEDTSDDGVGCGSGDEEPVCAPTDREIGPVDFALKGLAGDEPSDLAADGLGYPEGVSVRYLGNAFDVAARFDPASSMADPTEEPELHPGWRGRLEGLRGELPGDLLDDAITFLKETGPNATPTGFIAEFTRRRAAASLTAEDFDVHRRAERLGALDPARLEAGNVGRLSTAGRAHLRTVSGQFLLVPEGSPVDLVMEAAERSRLDGIEEQRRDRDRYLLGVLADLFEPARALSLEAVLGRLGGTTHKDLLRRLVKGGYLEARRIEGEVILCDNGAAEPVFRRAARLTRRVRSESFSNKKAAAARARARGSKAFLAPMVPFGGTKVGPGELPAVLELEKAKASARDSGRTAARVEHPGSWGCEISVGREGAIHALPVRHREVRVFRAPIAGTYHAWPVSVTTVLHDPDGYFEGQRAEERAAGFSSRRRSASEWADRLPESERESGPSPEGTAGRSFLDAERRDEAVIGTFGRGIPNPSRSPRQRTAAKRRVGGIVARAEAKARAEARAAARIAVQARKAAWDAALSIHLASLPAADRLELFLQLNGCQRFAALERSAKDPKGLKLAARELADVGRIKVRRDLSFGEVVIEAAEDVDRKGLEKELLKVMALAGPGEIEVPKRTRLARRVAATKAALTRARARESTSMNATQAADPVRVAA